MGDSVSGVSDYHTTPPAQVTGPPTKLEVLGEHLYVKVTHLQDTLGVELDVAKLTGILLELGEKQVLKLLEDDTLLHEGVKRVMQHVPSVCQSALQSAQRGESGEVDNDVEELLYNQVLRVEPALATHITGMLLELGSTQVKSLLDSPTRLTQAVLHAKDAFFRQRRASDQSMASQESQEFRDGVNGDQAGEMKEDSDDRDDDSDVVTEEMEILGEMVYAEVESLYPHSAAKLTGMVLDMGVERVKVLLQDRTQLHQHVHKAFASLTQS